ncbi:MAG: VUT family protein [Candidatus Nanosynbacter sp.]|nr:VUT family protein [Candidatus Nanosynbacter sp.]
MRPVYGYKYTRRAIWAAFGIMLLAVAAFTVVRYMPPAPEYTAQASYEAVLGFFPRIVAGQLGSVFDRLVP